MASKSEKAAAHTVTNEVVIDFLKRHPDFLADNPALLDRMTPPSRATGDGIVDMQRFMIDRLRGRHDSLLASGRRNLSKQAQINDAVLALLGAATLDHLIEIIAADFLRALHVDVALLCVEGMDRLPRRPSVTGVVCLAPGVIDGLLGTGRRVRIISTDGGGDERIYGAAAGLVRTGALIRLGLGGDAPAAMLALGSRQRDRFREGQGSEALGFLGRVLERCLNRWLDLPQG